MLRLSSRSRNRNVKNKHSKKIEKNTQEKSKYEEDYNEIILNDLVPEENKKEFGLDNESNQKKQGGLKLNFALGGKKRPNKKQHHNPHHQHQNQDQETSDVVEDVHTNKQQSQENMAETNKTKKSPRPKKRPNHKKSSNNNQETQSNENLKNSKTEHNNKEQHGHNKSSQSEESQGKPGYGKQAHHKNGLGKSSKKAHGKLKKSQNDDKESISSPQEKNKSSNQKVINPKKRKGPHTHKEEIEDEVRSLEEVEPEAEIEVKEDDSKDIITFRGDETTEENNNIEESQQKASEIKEVQSKFENIVWSEDKFPKK